VSDKRWITGSLYTREPKRGKFRGQIVYGARVWVPTEKKYRHFTLKAAKERDATRELRGIQADPESAIAWRERPIVSRLKFSELVDQFLKGYKSRGGTRHYETASKSWKGFFGKLDASDVTRARVEVYRDHLRREEYGDSTVRKYLVALSTMFRWAIVKGLIESNPAEGVRRPPEPDREVVVLSRDDEKALLEVADRETRLVIDFYLASGMRRGEALDLRWNQVDRNGGAILIHKSKTGKGRSIPLNNRLTGILDRLSAVRHLHSDFVLCDRAGKPLDRYVLTRQMESAFDAAEVTTQKGTCFNLFRHTFGSRLAEAGHSMATIARIMGNSAAVCERHYIRFSPGHLKAAMASLDSPTATDTPTAPEAPEVPASGSEESVQVV
jgi:integrase